MNDRVLVIVNSVYQLFTAVHLRRTLLAGCTADAVLTDILPRHTFYAERLEDTGLFDRVLCASPAAFNAEFAAKKGAELDPAFRDIPRRLNWMLSAPLDTYTEVYFSNYDPFTRMLASCYYGLPCEFVCYEDGFSTYVIDYLRPDRAAINKHPEGRKIAEMVRRVLLFEPHLAVRGDALENQPIPKIHPEDDGLRRVLNHVFDYRPPENRADFIFLEQSFRAEKIRTNDLELMTLCRDALPPGRFAVKPHPRNAENLALQMGLTRKFDADVPWELLLLNEPPRGGAIITVCSNAALTPRIVFGMDLNTVMLYRLFEGKVLWKEDDVLRRYLHQFYTQFAGENYYVPQTAYELRETLNYLGGRHE